MEQALLIIAVTATAFGVVLYFLKKDWRSFSYGLLALGFLALGVSGALKEEPSSLAAFLLCLVALRKIKVGRSTSH